MSAWVAFIAAATIVAVPIAQALALRPSRWPEGLRPRLTTMPVVLKGATTGEWPLYAEPHAEPVIGLRAGIYSTSYVRDYQFTLGVCAWWEGLIDRTKPEYALLKTNAPLTVALRDQLSWTTVGNEAGYALVKAS